MLGTLTMAIPISPTSKPHISHGPPSEKSSAPIPDSHLLKSLESGMIPVSQMDHDSGKQRILSVTLFFLL